MGKDPIDYHVYPGKKSAPPAEYAKYMARRRAVAYEMYALQGVGRKDAAARMTAMAQNWEFFNAPVGIIVTVDRVVDRNGWGHTGSLSAYSFIAYIVASLFTHGFFQATSCSACAIVRTFA